MKNDDFHEMQFRLGETPLCDPKAAQDEAKIAPRSPQDGLKTVLKRDRFLRRFFDRFLVVLGSVLAPFWHPRWSQKSTQAGRKIGSTTLLAVNRPEDRPKMPQDGAQNDQKSIKKSSLKTMVF